LREKKEKKGKGKHKKNRAGTNKGHKDDDDGDDYEAAEKAKGARRQLLGAREAVEMIADTKEARKTVDMVGAVENATLLSGSGHQQQQRVSGRRSLLAASAAEEDEEALRLLLHNDVRALMKLFPEVDFHVHGAGVSEVGAPPCARLPPSSESCRS